MAISPTHVPESDLDLWRRPAALRGRYADYRHGQLHFRIIETERPTSPPVLILHQSGSSGRCYERLAVALAVGRSVAVLDTPGFGASDPIPYAPDIEDFALAAEELVDTLRFGAIDVLGDHTGSATAIEMALRRPTQVRRLVLNGTPIFAPEEVAALAERDRLVETCDPDGGHVMMRWVWRQRNMSQAPAIVRQMEFVEALRSGPFAFHGHHAALRYDWRGRLQVLEQPALILRARDDLWEATGRARGLRPNVQMLDLPDYQREMILMHHAEVAAVARGFFDA